MEHDGEQGRGFKRTLIFPKQGWFSQVSPPTASLLAQQLSAWAPFPGFPSAFVCPHPPPAFRAGFRPTASLLHSFSASFRRSLWSLFRVTSSLCFSISQPLPAPPGLGWGRLLGIGRGVASGDQGDPEGRRAWLGPSAGRGLCLQLREPLAQLLLQRPPNLGRCLWLPQNSAEFYIIFRKRHRLLFGR